VLLGLLPFALLTLGYLIGSANRLAANPDDKLLPSPVTLADSVHRLAAEEDLRSGEILLWNDTRASLKRLGIALALCATIGTFFGVLTGAIPYLAATLSPFIAALSMIPPLAILPILFIVLGLDSFIWSIVSGSRPVVGLTEVMVEQPPELCSRVWSQAIIAVGMFGLGAIAMVCNITSLFLWQQSSVRDEDSRNYLRFFLLVVTAGAVLGVTCFVGSDTMNYLDVVYSGHPPVWFTTATAIVTFGGLAIALAVGARAYFAKMLRNDRRVPLRDRMRLPSFLIAVYALVGAVGVTAAARFPDWPDAPATWLVLIYWTIGLVLPVVVVILVARAIPPAKSPRRVWVTPKAA